MKKKLYLVFALISLLTLTNISMGAVTVKESSNHQSTDADEQWTPLGYGIVGQDWLNPEHWWHDHIPTAMQKAKINRVPGPMISGTVDINDFYLAEGNANAYEYPPCTAIIQSGANLTIHNVATLGYYPADDGTIQIDGGTATVNKHMFVGRSGKGHLIMNGGTLNVLGNFVVSFQGGTGTVKLNGGTLHLKQLTYEWPWQEKVNLTDPDVAITPGTASIDISGGQIIHDSNARDCNAVADIYKTMASKGKLTGYNGRGDAVAKINPATYQVIVTGEMVLWDYTDITVKSHSTMDNDALFGINKMFKSAGTDPNASVFLNGPGAGAVYTVEWETPGDVTLKTIQMIAERDADANHFRAVRHFTLKAKVPSTSPTFNTVIYDGDVSYTTGNVYSLSYNLPSTITSSQFRAEFTGNDEKAVRVRMLNATGTRQEEHLWNANQIVMVPGSSPVILDPLMPGMFDIANMFEPRRADNLSTIFMNGTGAGAIYNVVFRPIEPAEIHSFEFVAEKDAIGSSRTTTHLTLKAKSLGSSTYDAILYNGNIAIADYNNNVYRLNVNLAPANYVIAKEIRAEFTGGIDANGVRIRELNAMGVKKGVTQLWEPGNVVILNRSPIELNAQRFDPENVFQTEGAYVDPCSTAMHFENGSGPGQVYFMEWKTRNPVEIETFNVKATHDSALISPLRAMNHLTVKAKSIGSSTYDLTLYDAAVAVPYGSSYDANVLDLWVNLPSPVTAQEFKAEFTGNDGLGVRVNELNALGYIIPEMNGDMDADADIDLKDFADFADDWKVRSTASGSYVLDNFESYSTIPNTNWNKQLGYMSSRYTLLTLDTSVFHPGTGNKSLKWTYDLTPFTVQGDDPSGIIYTLPAPIDLRNYSQFRVWLKRAATNSLENYIAVKFFAAGAYHESKTMAQSFILSAEGSTVDSTSQWREWIVDFSNELAFTNPTSQSIDDVPPIGTIMLVVCNRLEYTGTKGVINVDDMTLTPKCANSESDFNNDCVVDFQDLKYIADNWLQGK
jgi:hypothetical protein